MNTAELKNILKLRIDFINDKKFLSALNTLIESKTENIIVLTKEQKKIINQSQKEYSEGNFSTNDVVNEETGEIIDQDGFFLYRDRSTLNSIEDIAAFIIDLLVEQKKGNLPYDLLFIWDSVGSIP